MHGKCLSDTISGQTMKGDPMVISLTEDLDKINPKKWYTPIPTPLYFKDSANALLDELIKNGVIRQIKLSSSPKFCARGFLVAKPGGGPQRSKSTHKTPCSSLHVRNKTHKRYPELCPISQKSIVFGATIRSPLQKNPSISATEALSSTIVLPWDLTALAMSFVVGATQHSRALRATLN